MIKLNKDNFFIRIKINSPILEDYSRAVKISFQILFIHVFKLNIL